MICTVRLEVVTLAAPDVVETASVTTAPELTGPASPLRSFAERVWDGCDFTEDFTEDFTGPAVSVREDDEVVTPTTGAVWYRGAAESLHAFLLDIRGGATSGNSLREGVLLVGG